MTRLLDRRRDHTPNDLYKLLKYIAPKRSANPEVLRPEITAGRHSGPRAAMRPSWARGATRPKASLHSPDRAPVIARAPSAGCAG
jgi:hypothetical protein